MGALALSGSWGKRIHTRRGDSRCARTSARLDCEPENHCKFSANSACGSNHCSGVASGNCTACVVDRWRQVAALPPTKPSLHLGQQLWPDRKHSCGFIRTCKAEPQKNL